MEKGQDPRRMVYIQVEKYEWNGNIMGYKGEGEWGLRELFWRRRGVEDI